MSLLAMIMGAVITWTTVLYGNQPIDSGLVVQHTTPQIQHIWFASDDYRQAIVQKAYNLWWLPFVIMIECENGTWDQNRISRTNDHWICQLNYRYNKEFINSDLFNDVNKQLEYCYEKWKINPNLWYWPSRKIKGVKCKDYVKTRFIFE